MLIPLACFFFSGGGAKIRPRASDRNLFRKNGKFYTVNGGSIPGLSKGNCENRRGTCDFTLHWFCQNLRQTWKLLVHGDMIFKD
jgi:hypothetical protein